jgi:hypothetical protein
MGPSVVINHLLNSAALRLANRIAPVISASILTAYAFRGTPISITGIGQNASAVQQVKLSPTAVWRAWLYGGG